MVNLQKGQKVSLTKDNNDLSIAMVGLGWDAVNRFALFRSADIDCDSIVFMLRNGHLVDAGDIVCYRNLTHNSKSVVHHGDNTTGDGDGDDEQISIDLSKIPEQYDRIVVAVNIYDCKKRGQHFGMIRNAFIRVVDEKHNRELCRYDLSGDYSGYTAMIFGELYRHGKEWKFHAIGEGTYDTSIDELARRFY